MHSLENYLNMKGFLEKSLNIKLALKSAGKWLLGLEKYLDFAIFGIKALTLFMGIKSSIKIICHLFSTAKAEKFHINF